MKPTTSSGFTLIELLVVVAIISLLSTVVLGAVQNGKLKAQNTAKVSLVKQYVNAFELYRLEKNYYPNVDPSSSPGYFSYCLGSDNEGAKCYNNDYPQNTTLNTELSPYIAGPPADKIATILSGLNMRGIVYNCVEKDYDDKTSTYVCTKYSLRWFLKGDETLCAAGAARASVTATDGSYVECTYTTS